MLRHGATGSPSCRRALFLRAIVVFGLLGDMPLFSDALAYSDQAEDLVNSDTGDRPYFWPVGTSYVLAAGYWAFGTHVWVAHALMVIVSVLAVVTTALVARRLLRDARPALLAGWALALYPECGSRPPSRSPST